MTGPRVEVPSGKLGRILSPEEFDQLQALPGHAIKRDPFGKQTEGPPLSRILSPEEFDHAQTLSGTAVKALKIPFLPPIPAAPRDVTRTPSDPRTTGYRLGEGDPGLHGILTRQLVAPVVEHPFITAGAIAAPFAGPVAALATATAMGGMAVSTIAEYGWQKYVERDLSPDARAELEKDPERVSGEAAAFQAVALGLAPLVHVALKTASGPPIGDGMVEAGTRGFFEHDAGATALGAAAGRHGLPPDASPYPPASPLAAKWQEGHAAATESFRGVASDAAAPTMAEAIKPRTPSAEPVADAGFQTRGLSLGIEEKAIAARLTQGFDDLPKYQQVSMADQAMKATDLLTTDAALARRIALGETSPPDGLLPESVLVAVENKAIADGDVATLRDLASGKLAEQATEMGQRIRTLAERDPESPVGAIKSVMEIRMRNTPSVPKATAETVATIRKQISASARKPKDWAAFVDSLRCS